MLVGRQLQLLRCVQLFGPDKSWSSSPLVPLALHRFSIAPILYFQAHDAQFNTTRDT